MKVTDIEVEEYSTGGRYDDLSCEMNTESETDADVEGQYEMSLSCELRVL